MNKGYLSILYYYYILRYFQEWHLSRWQRLVWIIWKYTLLVVNTHPFTSLTSIIPKRNRFSWWSRMWVVACILWIYVTVHSAAAIKTRSVAISNFASTINYIAIRRFILLVSSHFVVLLHWHWSHFVIRLSIWRYEKKRWKNGFLFFGSRISLIRTMDVRTKWMLKFDGNNRFFVC